MSVVVSDKDKAGVTSPDASLGENASGTGALGKAGGAAGQPAVSTDEAAGAGGRDGQAVEPSTDGIKAYYGAWRARANDPETDSYLVIESGIVFMCANEEKNHGVAPYMLDVSGGLSLLTTGSVPDTRSS